MDDARSARADAKAATARAKALRPWYRKKRWILSMVVGALIALSAIGGIASGGKNDSAAGSANNDVGVPSSATVSSAPLSHFTTASHPAADDVDLAGCELDHDTGFGTATLAVTNHSSKESNYIVTVEFADAHGTQVGTADGFVNNVSSGQRARSSAVGTYDGPEAGVTCQIKSVDRMAS